MLIINFPGLYHLYQFLLKATHRYGKIVHEYIFRAGRSIRKNHLLEALEVLLDLIGRFALDSVQENVFHTARSTSTGVFEAGTRTIPRHGWTK